MRVLVLTVVLAAFVAAATASVVRDGRYNDLMGKESPAVCVSCQSSRVSDLSATSTANTSIEVTKIIDPVWLGEGPHWDHRAQALYFLDVPDNTIHKYVLATGAHTKTRLGARAGFIVPVEGTLDQFLLGLERQFVVVQWDGAEGSEVKVVRIVGEVDQHAPQNMLNDGKADPRGRIFAGTMGPEETPGQGDIVPYKGALFRLDGGGITQVDDKISIANGLAWDLERNVMYYIDTLERKLRRYDYDVETGEISNMHYFFDLLENGLDGTADGSTIDTDGNLWVAVFGTSSVIQVSPQGELLRKVLIPSIEVTSCTFGGPNYDILFVTTADYLDKTPEESSPYDGATFMVTGLGVKGHPNVTSCPNYDILFVTTADYLEKVPEIRSPYDGATFMVTGLGVKGYPNVNFKF